jgi:hypothetical protein
MEKKQEKQLKVKGHGLSFAQGAESGDPQPPFTVCIWNFYEWFPSQSSFSIILYFFIPKSTGLWG